MNQTDKLEDRQKNNTERLRQLKLNKNYGTIRMFSTHNCSLLSVQLTS